LPFYAPLNLKGAFIMQQKQNFLKYFSTRNIALMAILSAISFILYMFVKFPLPFMFPGFLDMQFSDLPALLGGFAIGPFAGGVIIVVKCLLKMPFSSTACVGELADIIVGLAFVLPAAFFYKYNRTKKGAILAMVLGTTIAIAVSLIANRFILIPFFAKEYGMGREPERARALSETIL
jgi:riboflavin transporter FmnP